MTLQFQRNPYKPEMRTVWTAWNRIVVLDDIVLRLGDDGTVSSLVRDLTLADKALKNGNLNQVCKIEQLEMMRIEILDTRRDDFHASDGQRSLLFADKQVGA